ASRRARWYARAMSPRAWPVLVASMCARGRRFASHAAIAVPLAACGNGSSAHGGSGGGAPHDAGGGGGPHDAAADASMPDTGKPDGMAPDGSVSYSTSFDKDESPISEGGAWVHLGLDWALVATAGGVAHGTQTGTGKYDDSYAHLSGFPPDHMASAVIHRD